MNFLCHHSSVAVAAYHLVYSVAIRADNVCKILLVCRYGNLRERIEENRKLITVLNSKIINSVSVINRFINGKLLISIALIALERVLIVACEQLICNRICGFLNFKLLCDDVSVRIL